MNNSPTSTIRPLARHLARELTHAEIENVSGGLQHITTTGNITHRDMNPPDEEYVRDK